LQLGAPGKQTGRVPIAPHSEQDDIEPFGPQ